MQWRAGDPAPDFLALDVQGRRVRPRAGGNHVLLVFLRDPAEASSRGFLARLSEARDRLRTAGVAAAVFFPCGRQRLRAEVGAGIPGLPVVPDPQARVYTLFRVLSEPRRRLHALAQVRARLEAEAQGLSTPPLRRSIPLSYLPAQFLVAPDGRFVAVHYGRHPHDTGPAPDEVARLVAGRAPAPVAAEATEAAQATLRSRTRRGTDTF